MCRKRSAFTLVELLVVIGIISLLIAILLPSLARARQAAMSIQCLSNQRQIGIFTQMYNSEYNGMMPPIFDYNKNNWAIIWTHTSDPINVPSWLNKYAGTMQSGPTIWCPSAPRWGTLPWVTEPCGNYGANAWTMHYGEGNWPWKNKWYKITELRKASEILLLTDMWPKTDLDGWSSSKYMVIGDAYNVRDIDYRHNGRANVLFADGHAEPYAGKIPDDTWASRLTIWNRPPN